MKKNQSVFLIFLCWIVYSISYLGKVNYSANITQIIDFYNVSKAQAGLPPTLFFFAYGIGQVVNGLLCKKYNIKWTIFTALLISSVVNLVIAITNDFSVVKWLWLINGVAQSVLWPLTVRFLSENLHEDYLGKSSVIMGTPVAVGTLIVYFLSSIYAFLGNFKLSFYTGAFAIIIVLVFWLAFYNRGIRDRGACSEYTKKDRPATEAATVRVQQTKLQKRMLHITIGALCCYAVSANLIKEGLTTWLPSILKDEFQMKDGISIMLTLLLPVFAVFSNFFALATHKKISDYVTQCVVCFASSMLIIGSVSWGLSKKIVILVLANILIVNFLVSSLNSLITSIFPVYMRDKVNSGMFAGVLNGFAYLGSTISSYGLGSIAEHFGWNGVFYALIAVCLLCVVVWCVYAVVNKLTLRKTAELYRT